MKGLATVTFIFRHPCFKQLGHLKRYVKADTSPLSLLLPLRGAKLLIQIIFGVKLISKYHNTLCDT